MGGEKRMFWVEKKSVLKRLLIFWIKLTQKGYFRTKKNENYHRILHIQINLDSKFQLQQTILIFGINFQKKKSILPVENTKNEHHY